MKIGIFGGTFSPPHRGHIRAAEAFIRELGLHKLIVIPALRAPGKNGDETASAFHRLEMCRLAFDFSCCEISDTEIEMGGISYTFRTLEKLRERFPNDELYLLLGEDKLEGFGAWKGAEIIASLCIPVFVRREESEEVEQLALEKIGQYREQFGINVRRISVRALPLSSGEIREKIKKGEEVKEALPDSVLGYIAENRLYGMR